MKPFNFADRQSGVDQSSEDRLSPERNSTSKILLVAASVIGCLAILVSRRPDQVYSPQVWAEDAAIFFMQNYELGLKAVLVPYAGYLHLFPRLGAAVAGLAPVEWIPAIYVLLSVLAVAIVAGVVHLTRFSLPEKLLFIAMFVAVPHQGEVFLNLTNTQWILGLCLVLPLLCDLDRLTARQYAALFVVVAMTAATGPFSIVLSPVWFVAFCLGARQKRFLALFAVVVLIAAVQSAYLIDNPRVDPVAAQGMPIGGAYVQAFGRFFYALLVHFMAIDVWVIAIAAAFLVATLALGLMSAPWRDVALLLLSGAILYAAALYSFRSNPTMISAFGGGARYFYVPFVCISWALVVVAGRAMTRARVLSVVCLGLVLASAASQWRAAALDRFPWISEAQLDAAKGDVVVPINPPGWKIVLHKRRQ